MKNLSPTTKPSGTAPKLLCKKILNVLAMLLFPIATFYLFEWYTHNPWTTMKVPIQFLNIFFFEVVMCLLLAIFGKVKIACIVQTVVFMIIGLANYYVIQFRSAPIMPWDIYSLKTAASVANNFQYTLKKETIIVLVCFLILIFLETRVSLEVKKYKRLRIAGVFVSLGLLWGFTHMLHQDSTISKFKMYDKLFTPTVMSKRDGTAVAFLMELKYLSIDKPTGYSDSAAKELLASYEPDTASKESSSKPNIIVIMNEAFSDPAVLGDFTTNQDYMPFLHDLMENGENTVSGYLNVSVLGGNTANTEFEYLTGNTMAFLPQGSIPYQQYITGELPSMASHLKSLGYKTIAMHPYNSTGWERNQVYPLLGFDETYFIKDWINPKLIRKYVSDESSYDKIIDLYENKEEGTPMFLFNVTMQNHSSYSDDYDNFHPDITVDGVNSKSLTNYLSLMKLSDEALEDLIAYFSEQDEETIIVFFGDHQPTNSVVEPIWKLQGKTGSDLTDEEEAQRYKVPYIIWGNYDMTESVHLDTSVNFLSSLTLSYAGLPLNNYNQYLLTLMDSFPVVTSIRAEDSQGVSTTIKEQREALNTYETLQYYHLFGKNK